MAYSNEKNNFGWFNILALSAVSLSAFAAAGNPISLQKVLLINLLLGSSRAMTTFNKV